MSTDPLHPTGRCTCGGEGSCEWCLSHCIYCGSTVWPCDEDSALDYEALGYPETELWIAGVDIPVEVIADVWGSGMPWPILEGAGGLTRIKENGSRSEKG